MCEFHESTCNGFGDIWWTGNPIYFSSIDVIHSMLGININLDKTACMCMSTQYVCVSTSVYIPLHVCLHYKQLKRSSREMQQD